MYTNVSYAVIDNMVTITVIDNITFTINKYKFAESLHMIYFPFGYFWIIVDPLIVLLFNKKLRIDFKLIYNKLNFRIQTSYK